jgi:enoyl-CoA hydratase/carnithine racemase
MPTELIVTTRMRPVRQPEPLATPHAPAQQPDYDPELEHSTWAEAERVTLLKNMFIACLVGLAVGGYFSLLLHVRDRVISLEATIRELNVVQGQLREENAALRQRLATTSAANKD